MLSGLAAKYGLVFTSNGNKTEVALGYATLYGDVSGAVAPIADLYKVQVFALARFLNESVYGRSVVPENLLDGSVVPSAELSEAQDVTQGLGDPIKYGYHDAVLRQFIEYRRHSSDLLQWFIEGVLLEKLEWDDAARFRGVFSGRAQLGSKTSNGWSVRCGSITSSGFKRRRLSFWASAPLAFDLRETQQPPYAPRRCEQLKAEALKVRI